MRSELIDNFSKDNDFFVFLRENPSWVLALNRDPTLYKTFLEDYKTKRRKRLVDKLDDLSLMITLAKELM